MKWFKWLVFVFPLIAGFIALIFVFSSLKNIIILRNEIYFRQFETAHPAYASNAVYLNGNIYVIGGIKGSIQAGQTVPVWQDVYFYRTEVNGEPRLPIITTTKIPQSFLFSDAVAVDNKIFVVGGQSPTESQYNYHQSSLKIRVPSDTLYCAEVGADGDIMSWEKEDILYQGLTKIISQRIAYHKVVHLNVEGENMLFMLGGQELNSTKTNLNEVHNVYSLVVPDRCSDPMIWQIEDAARLDRHVNPQNPPPVANPSVVSYQAANGKYYLYLIGGSYYVAQNLSGITYALTNEIYRAQYYPITSTLGAWDKLTMPQPPLSSSMMIEGAVSGNYLYLVGGTDEKSNPDSSLSTLIRGEFGDDGGIIGWEKIVSDVEGSGRPIPPLHGHDVTVSDSGQLFIVNGSSNGAYQNKIYWTPLVFFEKDVISSTHTFLGGRVFYDIQVKSNNVRDLFGLRITDDIDDVTEVLGPERGVKTSIYAGADPLVHSFHLPIGEVMNLKFEVEVVGSGVVNQTRPFTPQPFPFASQTSQLVPSLSPMDISTNPSIPHGLVNTSMQSVFGPHACNEWGRPFPESGYGSHTYTYKITIPDSFPSHTNLLRVEIFDPDSINEDNNIANVQFSQPFLEEQPNDFPNEIEMSCNESNISNPCIIETGEQALVTNGENINNINPNWFVRVDENRTNDFSGSCEVNKPYDPATNTETKFELYYYQDRNTGTKHLLGSYTGQTVNDIHGTDLQWVSPGASQQGLGHSGRVESDFGTFEIDLDAYPDIYKDPLTNDRYLFLDVYATSGMSENGFELWVGPNAYVESIPSDINERNLAILNDATFDPFGVTIQALGYLPMNSIYANEVDIPLLELDENLIGHRILLSLFDADSGSSPNIEFFIEDSTGRQSIYTFPMSGTYSCEPPNCDNMWIEPRIEIDIPEQICYGGDEGACRAFENGRLIARYGAGNRDTFMWEIYVSNPAYIQNQAILCGVYDACIHSQTVSVGVAPKIVFLPIVRQE